MLQSNTLLSNRRVVANCAARCGLLVQNVDVEPSATQKIGARFVKNVDLSWNGYACQ